MREPANGFKLLRKETVGLLITIGDIKALLGKMFGKRAMEEILKSMSLVLAVDTQAHGSDLFTPFCNSLLSALRQQHLTRIHPKMLGGTPIGEIENPAAYANYKKIGGFCWAKIQKMILSNELSLQR